MAFDYSTYYLFSCKSHYASNLCGIKMHIFADLQKEQLARVRKATAREDFENRNAGRFRRIFPSEDKLKQQKYVNIMSSIFGVVMSGRAPAMQKEIQKVYNNQWRVSPKHSNQGPLTIFN